MKIQLNTKGNKSNTTDGSLDEEASKDTSSQYNWGSEVHQNASQDVHPNVILQRMWKVIYALGSLSKLGLMFSKLHALHGRECDKGQGRVCE